MGKFFLNREKLDQFQQDAQGLSETALCEKYGVVRWRDLLGDVPLAHFVCTLKAHDAGKLHATKMCRVNEYGPTFQKSYLPQKDVNHVDRVSHTQPYHPITNKWYRVVIRNLEDQAKFLGEWMTAFGMSEREFKLKKAARLEAAAKRLRAEATGQTVEALQSEYILPDTEEQAVQHVTVRR